MIRRAVEPGSLCTRAVVLFVADLLHPVDDLAVQCFLNRDVRHRSGRRDAVPVLLTWWTPDHISRPDYSHRAAPALHEPAARRDNERLAERVRMPIAARAGLERDVGAARACRRRRNEERVYTYSAGEMLRRPLH